MYHITVDVRTLYDTARYMQTTSFQSGKQENYYDHVCTQSLGSGTSYRYGTANLINKSVPTIVSVYLLTSKVIYLLLIYIYIYIYIYI